MQPTGERVASHEHHQKLTLPIFTLVYKAVEMDGILKDNMIVDDSINENRLLNVRSPSPQQQSDSKDGSRIHTAA